MRTEDEADFDELLDLYRRRSFSDKLIEEAIHDLAENFRTTRKGDDPSSIDVMEYLEERGIKTTRC
jgi:hypothetical protein